jgi:RNA polymerase sigma-70 factor (ECF subfamily)
MKRSPSAQDVPDENEPDLLARLLDGDEAAFRDLVLSYHNSLVRLAMTFVAERAVAEEVVQETWLGVVHGLRDFQRRSSLKTWIFRILANRARTRGKREARSIPFSSLQGPGSQYEPAVDPSRFDARGMWTDPPRSWSDVGPDELLARRETMGMLQREIEKLPPNQRAVVILHDVEGIPSAEICNILEINETNQRVLLHRARAKLRRALEQHLGNR